MMTYGSLCAGIGGIDLGLDRAGFTCRWQVEIDEYCRKVLARHWPKVPKHGDIKQLTGAELEPVDLIAGGYPCQPFSQAGKRAGTQDPRHLWPEFARLIWILRPRYVLLENVAGHLSLGFGDVLGDLARLGYDAEWLCLRASDFGASHLRKRVFIVAYAASDQRRRGHVGVSGSTIPARTGAARAEMADSARGGRGILREPSRLEGRLSDGRNADLVDGISARRQATGERCDVDAGREPEARCGNVGYSGREPVQLQQRCDGAEHPRAGDSMEHPIDGGSQDGRPKGARPVRDRRHEDLRYAPTESSGHVADPAEPRPSERGESEGLREHAPLERTGFGSFAPGPSDPRWPAILGARPDLAPALESPVRGMADGIPDWLVEAMSDRTKRLSRLGNAVVPQIAEWIGRRIILSATERPETPETQY